MTLEYDQHAKLFFFSGKTNSIFIVEHSIKITSSKDLVK